MPGRAPRRWPRRRARQRRPPQGLLRRLSRSAPLLGSCSCSSRGRGVGRRQTPIKTTGCSRCPLPLALGAIRTRRRERARRRSACRSGGAGGVVPPFIVQPYIRVVERRARMRRGAGGRPRSSRARIPARYRYLPDGGFTWGWPGSKSSAGTDQASLTHRLCLASSGCDLYQSQVYFS